MTTATAPTAVDIEALGVAVRLLVTDPAAAADGERLLAADLAALDLAASRFRPDSELVALNEAGGRTVAVGPLLYDAIAVALQAAQSTGGDVDPTLGAHLVDLGYDRDFHRLPADGPAPRLLAGPRAHWSQVQLDPAAGTVTLPPGVHLDLGATAKALGADRAAAHLHRALGCGVLVGLGGDLATAGPAPDGGWSIRVQDRPGRPDEPADGPTATVAITGGALATSSTAARRWVRGGQPMHHVLDPRTGLPAVAWWRTVSVAAPTCVAANTASTAAIVRGPAAVRGLHHPARLVHVDGDVTTVHGWPA